MIALLIDSMVVDDQVTGSCAIPVAKIEAGAEPWVVDRLIVDRKTADVLRKAAMTFKEQYGE